MEQILVIGCPGSGKTTLAKSLASKLDLPLVHLDALFWRDGWKNLSAGEFDKLLEKELEKPRWIIDGNYNRTLITRLRRADTVIYLDYPRRICLAGVIGRYFKNRGKTRSDIGGNCPEKLDFPFLKFVWEFNKKYRKFYRELLAGSGIKAYIFRSRRQTRAFEKSLCGKSSGK